jgi:TetR/AcrR family fatty acid metabolism transcriptional regulator
MPRVSASDRKAFVEERKAQILTAAAKVFAKKGFERATIADIAKEAKVAEGSIYNYFKNKADLLVSIPRQFVVPAAQPVMTELTASAAGAHPSPEQVLTTLAGNMVAVIRQNVDVLRVLLSSLPTMNQSTRNKYFEQVPLFAFTVLENYFRQQIKTGVFRKDLDPQLAARMFPGLLFPFLMLQEVLQLPMQQDYDAMIAHAIKLFLRGAMSKVKDDG